ncbi:piwi-like protein Siwi [Procambarus clarkii]|uniref:piwi-like protein Siwi n=1 Tax=Procambarus clarkii TaxID=6728 RepID=UPI0037429C1B
MSGSSSMAGRAARGRARGRQRLPPEQDTNPLRRPGQDELERQMINLHLQGDQDRQRGGSSSEGAGRGGSDGRGGRGSRGRGESRGRGRGGATREGFDPLQAMSNTKECVVWTRPQHVTDKKGTSGQPIILRANYYEVQATPDWALCMYHVVFCPDEVRTRVRKVLLRQHSQALGNYVFDGNQLYLARKLPLNPMELASKRPDNQEPYTVTIRFLKEIPPCDTQFLQIFSILLRRCYEHLGMTQVGRHFYQSREEVQNHKYRVAIWPGQVSSIRQHESGVLMVTDILHKFLRLDTVYDILRSIKNTRPDSFKFLAGKQLLGMVVMTRYNQRTYRIDDIAWSTTAASKFSCQGQDITYMDYYQKTYQVAIRDPHQPLLMSKPRKKDLRRGISSIYLIPELCVPTGLSDEMRRDNNLMKDFATWTRMAPDKRVLAIRKFNAKLFENQQVRAELQEWGLRFSQTLCQVRGRVLPGEVITQGGRTFTYDTKEADWYKNVKDVPMNVCQKLTNWVLVFPAKLKQEADDLLSGLRRVGRSLNLAVAQPKLECVYQDLVQEYVRAVGRHEGVQLVLCVLPNSKLDRYAAVKKHASVAMGVPSQMVLGRSLQNKGRMMSIITKIAIQINCKLGGEAWNVQIPFQNTMVVGYDAYHDSSRRGSSWGAVVASYNRNLTRYYGQVSRHANNEELTANFSASIQNALYHYVEVNARLPERVVVYRDGVGDGQLHYVKGAEIAAIKACFKANNFSPRFSFVVVTKRINTRLFAQGSTNGSPINPPPGTVCDDVITLPERYDFYLVSQRVLQGTVTPTSYNIIDDVNSNLDADRHQRLAYKLTYLYYNWMGPVRVPAPCLYAHKLAYVTGQAIHDSPHHNLCDKLWYL